MECLIASLKTTPETIKRSGQNCNKSRKYDHITDAMKRLYWLPIEGRIQYKVLVLMHTCVHNVAPPYLSSLLSSPIERNVVEWETDSPSTDS